jgi:hypothetical protein
MTEALPTRIKVDTDTAGILPSQRQANIIQAVEEMPVFQVMQAQTLRVMAFRVLAEQYPDYDLTALWLHANDVHIEMATVDPTNGNTTKPELPSAVTGASGPTT